MPYLTGLAKVAKRTGYPVVEIAGWKGRGHAPMGTVRSVVCHHTAGGKGGNYPSMNAISNGRPGLPGPLANYGLGRDGTIYVMSAGLAFHAGKVRADKYRNVHSIGIEAENTGVGEAWSVAQLDSYVKLCRALVDEFNLGVTDVVGHKEACSPVGRKIDPAFIKPGLTMAQFRGYVRKGYYKTPDDVILDPPKKPATTTGTTGKKPTSKPAVVAKKYPRVAATAATRSACWNTLLAAAGYDGATTLRRQRWLKKLGYYNGRLDGKWGPLTAKAQQRFLKAKGHYKGLIDGKTGPMTIRAEVAYLNAQRTYLNK